MSQNFLILYILQCRAKDFIERFEAQENRCFAGVYSLYMMAYSNYLILSDDTWLPSCMTIVEPCREGCQKIMEYLRSIIEIPNSFESDLKAYLSHFAFYEYEDDLDYMLDGSLQELISLGYRDIDCRLYEAGMKLNYDEVERLMSNGANPDVHISGGYSPEKAVEAALYDVYCLSDDVTERVFNAVDLYGVYAYWKSGVRCETQTVDDRDLNAFFQGAAYRMMEILICRKKSEK